MQADNGTSCKELGRRVPACTACTTNVCYIVSTIVIFMLLSKAFQGELMEGDNTYFCEELRRRVPPPAAYTTNIGLNGFYQHICYLYVHFFAAPQGELIEGDNTIFCKELGRRPHA